MCIYILSVISLKVFHRLRRDHLGRTAAHWAASRAQPCLVLLQRAGFVGGPSHAPEQKSRALLLGVMICMDVQDLSLICTGCFLKSLDLFKGSTFP